MFLRGLIGELEERRRRPGFWEVVPEDQVMVRMILHTPWRGYEEGEYMARYVCVGKGVRRNVPRQRHWIPDGTVSRGIGVSHRKSKVNVSNFFIHLLRFDLPYD